MDLTAFIDTPPWEWPKDAGETFHKILIDGNASAGDRLTAAELAGDYVVINDDLVNALLGIVRDADEPEPLRAQAAISLGPVLESADMDGFDDLSDVPIAESTFDTIRDSLHNFYEDKTVPKEVRRRILEASVRAPMDWHPNAIRDAYASGDREWMLTSVFAMRFVRGFAPQILEALQSADPEIHFEAVHAAGNWELDEAWAHVAALVADADTPKPLLLAAIEAVGGIRPSEALETLEELMDSDDEEIAEAVDEALAMAGVTSADDDDEEDAGESIN
jgi:hypothetical protein